MRPWVPRSVRMCLRAVRRAGGPRARAQILDALRTTLSHPGALASTLALAALVSFVPHPAFGIARAADPPAAFTLPVTESQLANGLTLLLYEDHRIPYVSVEVRYRVGSGEDPPGRSGFAHLFEHIMLQGSRHVPEDTGMRQLEEAGALERNGNTSADFTHYHETVPANEIDLALWIESDRMGFLLDNLTPESFSNQRAVVEAELRRGFESVPYGWNRRFVLENLYPASNRYHRLSIGSIADLDAATLDEAKAFYRTWYRPNNAVLCIAGDFDQSKVHARVDRYFGPIPARALPARSAPEPVVLDAETVVDVAAAVELPRLIVAWPTPRSWTADDANLQLAGRILGEGEGSALTRRLVQKDKTAQKVRAWQQSVHLGSMFLVEATPRVGRSVDELLLAIDDEIARLGQAGPSDDEVARLKSGTQASFIFDNLHLWDRSYTLTDYRLFIGKADYLAEYMARFAAVTPESVRRSVLRYLPKSARVVERIVPTPGAPIAGEVRHVSERRSSP